MSAKYKIVDEIPSVVLVARLNDLSDAITEGITGEAREFYMRTSAQCEYDADLVLAAAAKRIEVLEQVLLELRSGSSLKKHNTNTDGPKCCVCGTTDNLHESRLYGYRCDSPNCACF